METLETFGGNTKTPQDKPKTEKCRIVPSKKWCFTAFDDEMETLETKIKSSKNIKFVFGREICPTTKKEHSQGYIECETKIRPIEFFKTITAHWEKCKGSQEENIKYCTKDNKFETNFKIRKAIKDPLEGKTLYKWQEEIIKIINEPVDERKIYWYWESEGCTGKSTLAKHIVLNYQALVVGGKGNDIKFAVAEYVKTKDVEVVIYDIPRTIGNTVSYSSIEEIKNGLMFSNKYESGQVVFNSPHIIVFSNSPPNTDNLSKDRWVVRNVE